MMKTRQLKRANICVSEIGFGCMSLGADYRLNERMIHKAIDHGITYFDTADLYQQGANETMLGKAIRGKREGLVIATKVGNKWSDEKKGWDWVPRKNYILSAVDRSLKRLGVEQIDLYQLHGGTIDDPFDEVIEAFETLRASGKIKHFGLSSIRPNVFVKLARETEIVSNMMQYSLLDRRPEHYFEMLEKCGVGVMARGSLAKGILAGKNISNYLGYDNQSIEYMVDKLKSFLIEKISLSHLALAWVLRHKVITSAVVGVSNMTQLDELIQFPLHRDELISGLDKFTPDLMHNHYDQHLV